MFQRRQVWPIITGWKFISLELGWYTTAKGQHHIGVGTTLNFQKSCPKYQTTWRGCLHTKWVSWKRELWSMVAGGDVVTPWHELEGSQAWVGNQGRCLASAFWNGVSLGMSHRGQRCSALSGLWKHMASHTQWSKQKNASEKGSSACSWFD